MSKRSFTLIEILVATSIFIVMIVIGMATLSSITSSRSKITSLQNVQESGRLAMKMISNEVKKADLSVQQGSYYGFWIDGYYGWEPITEEDGEFVGSALRILKSGTPDDEKRVFKLRKLVGGSYQDVGGGQCDPSASPEGRCVLMMIDADTGGLMRESPLSSPDVVDITSLTFRGYHKDTSDPQKQPYVTIEMTIESRWQEKVTERETMNLKTTINPMYRD